MKLYKYKIFIKIILILCLISFFTDIKSPKAQEDNKVVYLTFDDGPPRLITNKILDVLKEHNVKATFFIVGKEIPSREDIVMRIYDEGHSIGIHTYSHNSKKIYSTIENFVNEMLLTQEKIKAITNHSSYIIRFPWGTNNPYRKLTPEFLMELHSNNFKIYDWNVDIKDGLSPDLSPQQFLNNSKKIKGNYNGIIILMHCNSNNRNTVKALPNIIKYYRDLGYDFKAITPDTEEYYHLHRKK